MASEVASLINDARNYALTIMQQATAAINQAMGVALGFSTAPRDPSIPFINLEPPPPTELDTAPVYSGIGFQDPGLTVEAPILKDIIELDLSGDPGLAPLVRQYVAPDGKPSGAPGNVALLENAPTPGDLTVAEAPDLLSEIRGITAPSLLALTIKDAPNYVEPEFLGHSPTPPPAPPTGLDVTMANAYSSVSLTMRQSIEAEIDALIDRQFPGFRSGLAALEDRLTKFLAGGTALSTAVQDQIIDRISEKTDAEYRRGRDNVYAEAAKMGHTLPSPIIFAKQQEMQQAKRNANAQGARDMAVKIAEMEQQNIQFAVTQSTSLRGIMVNAGTAYFSSLVQINGQAVQYATALVDSIVKTYDLATKAAEIQTRIYEAEGNIYGHKVTGALGALEAYKSYVDGQRARVDLSRAQVDAYTARIGAVKAEADVYVAQISGVQAQAQIEKLKTEIYQARVSAYGAQVNAWVATWSGYEAAIRGETAAVQASAEQVRGFQASTEAYRAIIGARVEKINGIVKVNEGNTRVYESAVNAYRSHVAALADVDKAQIDSFDVTLKGFVAKANAQAENDRARLAHFEASLRSVLADFDMNYRILHEANALDISRINAFSELSVAAAHNYASTAQSALSGLNTLAADVLNTSS